jgi:hypothetical protein
MKTRIFLFSKKKKKKVSFALYLYVTAWLRAIKLLATSNWIT